MSTSTHSTNPSQKTMDFRQKYKTQRCRYWYERGFCPFNQFCAFAHAEEELRGKAQLNEHYKTKICLNFRKTGCCKYGDRCQFLHPKEASTAQQQSEARDFSRLDTLSERPSSSSSSSDHTRHQKHLSILSDYGLDLLTLKKGKRSQRWRSFLLDGVDQYEVESFQWNEFENQFEDYDFKRKPRLGSM